MTRRAITYNERSWAIDLIAHLKQLAAQQNRAIKDAGGEQTIRTEDGNLFPDVLLFDSAETRKILQGWELKMPDTRIDDIAFRENAERKARELGLNSFLLWNVARAHLYIRERTTGVFVLGKAWDDLADVTARSSVASNRARWKALAETIMGYLNDLFDRGVLEGRPFIDAYRSGGVIALIMRNVDQIVAALLEAERRNAILRAEMTLWWDRCRAEYATGTREHVLAQAVILNWMGKILFAHILRERDERARRVAMIGGDTTPKQALALFRQMSEDCNFWTIFSDSVGLEVIPDAVWVDLKQFNNVLDTLRIGSADQGELSNILESVAEVAVRKLRGQYPTPIVLARLLSNLCLRNIVDDKVLDPCCGSGTIVRAVMEQKLSSGVAPDCAAATVFVGDQDPQAVQIVTFALAKPDLMYIPLRVFQKDAFTLSPMTSIDFRDPSDGSLLPTELGHFHAIISNLPFVAQEGRAQYRDVLEHIAATMMGATGDAFTKRADVAAYLPFALYPLLAENGRLGIVITNAWLGTDWGDAFYDLLSHYYHLRYVVTSGSGRWFKNSKVVTNILVLDKKIDQAQQRDDIRFVVLTRPLETLTRKEDIQLAAARIQLGQTQNENMIIRSVTSDGLAQFRRFGLGGNAQFVDSDWVLQLPLVPLADHFIVRRGERRGMNKLFYPDTRHGIESEYIKPFVKNSRDFLRFCCAADREAFSCSRTEDELERLGHSGALNWIRRFKTAENIEKLKRKDLLWYEMHTDALTELVMSINYGERLFVGRINPAAFVDQRLMRLMPRAVIDMDLAHALLNSTISLFMIEGIGFGRGEGALDLNKDRINDFMHILNPAILDQAGVDAIKAAFAPLLTRNILNVSDELKCTDRQAFDDAVIAAFGLRIDRRRIYSALLALVGIRHSALT